MKSVLIFASLLIIPVAYANNAKSADASESAAKTFLPSAVRLGMAPCRGRIFDARDVTTQEFTARCPSHYGFSRRDRSWLLRHVSRPRLNEMEKPAQLLRTNNKCQRWQAAGEGVATEAVAAGSGGFARLMRLERPCRCSANRSGEPVRPSGLRGPRPSISSPAHGSKQQEVQSTRSRSFSSDEGSANS
jgi:hypothetical protein